MPRIAYVNGRYLPHADASVHIEDRGYQFADGVYEVVYVRSGKLLDCQRHLDRLDRSLAELRIERPLTRASLLCVIDQVIRRNKLKSGLIYLQVTRGVAPRDHAFPHGVHPALVVTAKPMKPQPEALVEAGVGVITTPDLRWARCDIKSVGLLPNVLAKQSAKERGAYEAWLIDRDGQVTEGSSTNAWIVTSDGKLVTRALGPEILPGVTRAAIRDLAAEAGVALEERSFSISEALQAREAFLTSASSFVLPIVSIDGSPVGSGSPGHLARRLRDLYLGAA